MLKPVQIKLIITFTAALLLSCISVSGAPALSEPHMFTQPDGTEFIAVTYGDEFLSRTQTEDGYMIDYDTESGCWYYMANETERSDRRVGIDEPPETVSSAEIFSDFTEIKILRSASNDDAVNSIQPIINWRQQILVIMVEFNDIKFVNDTGYWHDKMFSPYTNSVSNYYDEVSGGKFSFVPAKETYGEIDDGIIKINLDADHPNPSGLKNTSIFKDIINDVIAKSEEFADYSVYDTNNDSIISGDEINLIMIMSGYEMSASFVSRNAVWAHSIELKQELLSGIMFDNKCMIQGEMMDIGAPLTIGVFVHELGHSLGLPDLYDYGNSGDNIQSSGIGAYCLMGIGSWGRKTGEMSGSSPVHICAYLKMKLGFIEPEKVITVDEGRTGAYILKSADHIADSDYRILKVIGKSDYGKEFFIVENRQQTGYDAGLQYRIKNPDYSGILIYHIDESVYEAGGRINDNCLHKAVDLEEADGSNQLDTAAYNARTYSNHFYTPGGNNMFNEFTLPNSSFHNSGLVHMENGDCNSLHPQIVPSGISIMITGSFDTYMEAEVNPEPPCGCDLNKDGRIDILDAVCMQKIISDSENIYISEHLKKLLEFILSAAP